MRGNFDNTGKLVRFILRRERIMSTVWIVVLLLFSVGLAPALEQMFGGVEARMSLIGMVNNPSMIAMMGPAYGHDEKDVEKFAKHKIEYQAAFPQYYEYLAKFTQQEKIYEMPDSDEAKASFMIKFDIYLDKLDESDAYKEYMKGFEDYLAENNFTLSYNTGALYSNFMLLWVIITVGVMNIFFVVRHTRADEEKGREEVVRSLPAGRLANINAVMIAALIINIILALSTGVGIAAAKVEGMDFAGSMLYGAALGVSGLFFAAVAALFAQLSSSSRGATGLSLLTLGIIYMIRAAGDMNSSVEILSYISPMGLIQRAQIYVENNWLPVIIVLIISVAVAAVAYALNFKRDMDQGFIPARPGKKQAGRFLSSSSGLALRLLRNTIIAWFLCIFIISASYGTILGTDDFEKFIESSEFYAQLLGTNPDYTMTETFVSTISVIMSFIALVPALTAALKLRGEEKEGRAEHVLARVVSRAKFLCGYTTIAYLASILMQCGTALGIYASASAVLANSPDINITLGYLFKVNFVYLPAIWVMIGATILLVGLIPKAASAVWGYYGLSFFLIFIGRLPGLVPEWLQKITPFAFIPQLPMDEINYATLAVLTGIALVLTFAGLIFYTRRDTQA